MKATPANTKSIAGCAQSPNKAKAVKSKSAARPSSTYPPGYFTALVWSRGFPPRFRSQLDKPIR